MTTGTSPTKSRYALDAAADFWFSPLPMWDAITNLADVSVTFPALGLILGWLLLTCPWPCGMTWAAAVAGGGAALLTAKLGYWLLGFEIPSIGLRTISGHAMVSAVAYGSAAVLSAQASPAWFRWLIGTTTVLVLAAIDLSRLMIGAHSLSEVVAGLVLGLITLALACRLPRRHVPGGATGRYFAALFVVVIAASYGHRIRSEEWVIVIAEHLRSLFAAA